VRDAGAWRCVEGRLVLLSWVGKGKTFDRWKLCDLQLAEEARGTLGGGLLVVLRLELDPCWIGESLLEERASLLEARPAGDGEETVVADLDEAVREHVEEETLEELEDLDRYRAAVLGGEGDVVLVDLEQASIRDSDTVRVASEVAQEVVQVSEGGLGVDQPGFLRELSSQRGEGAGVFEFSAAWAEAEETPLVSTGHSAEKPPTEARTEHPERGEEALTPATLPVVT